MLKESDFNYLKEILGKNPDLRDAFFNYKFDIEDPGDIGKVINKINYPLLICENPDKYLQEVQKQINFILPPEMRKSKDLYVKNIKNDINMYKKLYEKFSTIVNKIINETKECLKNLYKPFKSLHDDINKYSKNFDKSIEQLTIPLKNGKKGLVDIKYENYSKDKQNQFFKDKKEIIEEIDNFIQEASEFYSKYKTLNKATSDDISNFVERFKKLPEPALELSKFMTNFIKVFEQSAKYFNKLDDKKQIDERLRKIKEPIFEFQKKKII
jgi:phage-related tail protein